MGIIISDLLDTLPEVDLDIAPSISVPADRIEELTMKKLQKYEKPRKRGVSFVTKVLIAAILIAALAIPVMAATGFSITDWLVTPQETTADEKDPYTALQIGFDSTTWAASNYVLTTSCEDADAVGLTFVCEEIGDGEPIGTLTASDGYWLEKWEGNQFLPLEGQQEGSDQLPVADDAVTRWEINWESVYGQLDSGSYRLGKLFTYTSPEGNVEEITVYVKFRIFTQDMASYVAQGQAALEALLSRDSYHLTETKYDTNDLDYDYYTTEVWKSGNDYLEEVRYCLDDGTVLSRRGCMLRDGVGYTLDWEGDSVTSRIISWERADYVDITNFTLWEGTLSIEVPLLGQVFVEEDLLYFYEYYDWMDETEMTQEDIEYWNHINPTWNHDYREKVYRFDEAGALTGITYSQMRTLDPETGDPFKLRAIEVHDTPAEDIAEIIRCQNVTDPPAFSWEADRTGHYTKLAEFDGFVNTIPISRISSAQAAIDRARAEADPKENPKYRDGYSYNMTSVWYDPDACIWKVRFYHSQDDYFQTIVWMDDNGVTQMKSLTSHEEFD